MLRCMAARTRPPRLDPFTEQVLTLATAIARHAEMKAEAAELRRKGKIREAKALMQGRAELGRQIKSVEKKYAHKRPGD